MGDKGNNQLAVEGQEEQQLDVVAQNLEREQEEENDELDIVRQQRVAIPQAAVKENAPLEEIRQEITNKGGAEGNESKDANFQGMLQGMEVFEQMLRQTVPETKTQQKQIAGNLRKSCSAIMQNANSYIRSHRLSLSKSVRESRRLAEEVSMKCQNDAMKLYIIMRNVAIQGQMTWEQVLGQTAAGVDQQPANNAAQQAVSSLPANNAAAPVAPAQAQLANNAAAPVAPVQAQPTNNAAARIAKIQGELAGRQLPKAETAKDFDLWGSILKTSEKGGIGFGNSKYFNKVLLGLQKVGHALKERFGKVLNDNVEKLGAAREALQSLLEACMSYTARNPRTAKGKARKGMVEKLQEYVAKDVKGCSNAMDAFFRMSEEEMEHETWETVLRSARSVKVNVQDFSKLETSRGGMSSEVVMLQTKTGTKYFKREDNTDLDEFKGSDDMVRDVALKETIEKYGEFREEDKPYIHKVVGVKGLIEEKHLEGASEDGKTALRYFANRYRLLNTNINTLFYGLELKDKGGKVNLSRRNVATSRVASLLELKDLIAESQTADIYDQATGKTIHGNLMNQAEGKEYGKIRENLMARRYKPSLIRDITNLQVLDVLCGQIDRHTKNILYKVDNDGNITGVQGIDNDAAFGMCTNTKNNGAEIFEPGGEEMMIPYMDAGLANRIMQLDGKMLRYVLMDLLKKEEIDMTIKRLKCLQKGIKNIKEKQAFRFLEKDEDWTLHDNDTEAQEIANSSKWTNVRNREQEDPELADKNRNFGRSVEYSFCYYGYMYFHKSDDKDVKRKTAEVLYGKSDPKRLKLLLQYYDNRSAFYEANEKKPEVVKEVLAMNRKVNAESNKKYMNSRNYFHTLRCF